MNPLQQWLSRCRQGPGISSEIETMIDAWLATRKFTGRQGPGISSEIETQQPLPTARSLPCRQGPGISSEIETKVGDIAAVGVPMSPGAWHLI